jgi:uncharacterized repeat protein (TIGR02543 family)
LTSSFAYADVSKATDQGKGKNMKMRSGSKLFIYFLCASFFLMVYGFPGVVRGDKDKNKYTLTVNVSPSGGGSVTITPNKTYYDRGDTVKLTATANSGYSFDEWTGDAHGSSNPVTITMNGNETVTANFKTKNKYTLTVYVSPSGAGSVTKNPNKPFYTPGETVQLTAIPSAGYCFSYWTGDAHGSRNPITITMNSNKTVTANFKKKKCEKGPSNCDD